jgi:hypothetical protein
MKRNPLSIPIKFETLPFLFRLSGLLKGRLFFILALLFLLSFKLSLFAQETESCCMPTKRAHKWIYGAGHQIDFSLEPPKVTFFDPQPIPDPVWYSRIPSQNSIADENGNLLFYTDGKHCYDRNHQIMPNGFFVFVPNEILNNDPYYKYSSEITMVVPKPGSSTTYFIFGVVEQSVCILGPLQPQTRTFLSYAVIDMSLRGGLGDKVGNANIVNSNELALAATQHQNGCDYWLVNPINGTRKFDAFLINASGVISPPISSEVSPIIIPGSTPKLTSMVFTPQGNKLIYAETYLPNSFYNNNCGCNGQSCYTPRDSLLNRGIHIYDFDRATGKLTFLEKIKYSAFAPNDTILGRMAFLATSASGKYLYINYGGDIYQLDLEAPNRAHSIQKITGVGSIPRAGTGGLMLAPDCKIYLSTGVQSLSAIENPEKQGIEANFRRNILRLDITNMGHQRWITPSNGICWYSYHLNYLPSNFYRPFAPQVLQKDTTLCPGTPFLLRAKAPQNTACQTYRYRWLRNGVALAGATDTVLWVTQAGSYQFEVINNENNSCRSRVVNISYLPPPEMAFHPSPAPYCSGKPLTLRPPVTAGARYEFLLGQGATLLSQDSLQTTIAPEQGGNLSLTLRAHFALGCVWQKDTLLTVVSTPRAAFSVTPSPACAGRPFRVQLENPSPGAQYIFTLPDTALQGNTYYDLPGYAATSFPITLSASLSGCAAQSEQVLVIRPLPVSDFRILPERVCAGDSFRVAPLTPQNTFAYHWSGLGQNWEGPLPKVFTTPQPGNFTISLTVSDSFCTGAPLQRSVTVHPLPQPEINLQASSWCAASSAEGIFTALPSGIHYQWQGPQGFTASGQTVTVRPLQSGVYTLTLIDANGCRAQAEKSVQLHPVPTLHIVSPALRVCAGSRFSGGVKLWATGGAPDYRYQIGSGQPQAAPVFSGLEAGIYSLTVIDANGCTDTRSITVEETPAVSGSVQVLPSPCQGNSGGKAIVTAGGGAPPYSYALQTLFAYQNPGLPGVPQPEYGANSTFEDLLPGEYVVLVRDSNGCPYEERISVVCAEGGGLQIYPNPSGVDTFIVRLSEAPVLCQGQAGSLRLYYLTDPRNNGAIREFTLTGITFPWEYRANASGLPAGQYLVELQIAGCNQIYRARWIKAEQ